MSLFIVYPLNKEVDFYYEKIRDYNSYFKYSQSPTHPRVDCRVTSVPGGWGWVPFFIVVWFTGRSLNSSLFTYFKCPEHRLIFLMLLRRSSVWYKTGSRCFILFSHWYFYRTFNLLDQDQGWYDNSSWRYSSIEEDRGVKESSFSSPDLIY